jgi:aminoglycoside phosphotransferase family enzyme/predicted kinase
LDADLHAWLMQGAGGPEPCERMIETSISWVFLYPDRVLKLKKPVDFGFLDFTSLEKRRWAAGRELEFNRANAPDIYRRVHAIVRRPDGGFELDGEGEPVEWALEMARFDETAVLSETPGIVTGDFAEALGRRVARMHSTAPPGSKGGGAAGLGYVVGSNAEHWRALSAGLEGVDIEGLAAATEAALARSAGQLDARLAQGLVRRCHGDLHLGNILLQAGRPVLFDCIEFNDAISEIDVLYDLAFLLMDLGFRGQAEGASRVFNGWLDEAARSFGEEVWTGLSCLGLMQSVRAGVRAHVSGHQGDFPASRRYLAAAGRHLEAEPARLLAIGGLSGTGKSTVARALAPDLGPAPGPVMLRSDEIRKRLWGRAPDQRLPPEAYAPEESQRVYDDMLKAAGLCLAAGWPVILDAVFLRPQERAAAEALATRAGVPFDGVWLEAPAAVLESRIAGRVGDASDADVAVLQTQLGRDPGPIGWTRLQAGDARSTAARALECIRKAS